MKSFGLLFVMCLVILDLLGDHAVEAAFNRNGNGVLYCKWSTRSTCSKKSTYCVRLSVTANMVTTVTCKLYQNECKFRMDNCLQQTDYGISGTATTAANCQGISVGQIATCT